MEAFATGAEVIEDDLVTFILADGTVSDLISDRLSPVLLPQTPTYPAVVYQRISGIANRTLDIKKNCDARYQFSCFAADTDAQGGYAAAKEVTAAVRSLFDCYRGVLVTDGVTVETEIEDDRDMGYDFDANAYRVDVDVLVTYPEN